MIEKDPYGHLVKDSTWSVSFIHAFAASISVIIVSELGDKTFFIAAIMAMRHPRLTVFLGAMTALGVMTILSGKKTGIGLSFSRDRILVQLKFFPINRLCIEIRCFFFDNIVCRTCRINTIFWSLITKAI